MGKDEWESAENKADENKKDTSSSNETTQKDEENTKKNTEGLRKVIKVAPQEEKKESPKQNEPTSNDSEDTSRETLEQRRAILQSIKDFDFQIKKNCEEITTINKKIDSITKDLDDLVSLYEIVSEQMNPFVGLSKVTKKRIEALENFTRDIEDLKNRMNDFEGFAETAGINLENLRQEAKLMDDKTIIDGKSEGPTNEDLDIIIEKSLNEMTFDEKIDSTIDEFIENLKDQKIN